MTLHNNDTNLTVLQELVVLKEADLSRKDRILRLLTEGFIDGLGQLEVLLEEEHFSPYEVRAKVQDLQRLISAVK